jgi:hypothetical protein
MHHARHDALTFDLVKHKIPAAHISSLFPAAALLLPAAPISNILRVKLAFIAARIYSPNCTRAAATKRLFIYHATCKGKQ